MQKMAGNFQGPNQRTEDTGFKSEGRSHCSQVTHGRHFLKTDSESCFWSFFVPEKNCDWPRISLDGFRMRGPEQACDTVGQRRNTWSKIQTLLN